MYNPLQHPYPETDYSLIVPSDNYELADELTRLAGHINAANYRFLKLLAVLIERKGWNHEGGIKTPAHWLNYRCGIAMGAAREKVRLAKSLAGLPGIDAAFRSGALSYSKVRSMTRVATPSNEDYLLYIARYGIDIETVDQAEVSAETTDNPKLANEHSAPDKNVPAGTFSKLLAVKWQERQEMGNIDYDIGSTLCKKRADALVLMAEHLLATPAQGMSTLSNGDKHLVMVHIEAQSAALINPDNPDQPQSHCYLEDGPFLAPQTTRRLACDASLVTVLEDADGEVLNVGRKTRAIPPSIHRALRLRDKGCLFPGCTTTRWVDAHHIEHWCDGGETRLSNGKA